MSLELRHEPQTAAGAMVTLRLPAVLRPMAADAREISCAAGTLAELLADLAVRHPELGAALADGGQLTPYVNLYVNGQAVTALETALHPGDDLVLITAIVGG